MRQRVLWWVALLSLLLLSQTAAAADSGVLNDVVDKFKQATNGWASVIQGYATWLFWTLATISLVWTFGFMALRKADIGEFFAEFLRFCIFTGFYLWLLRNGPEYAMSIIRSMMTIGAKAGGVAELNPSTPVDIAFDILERSFKSLSMRHPIDSIGIILVSLIILVCLATVAANVLLVLVTAWIMAYAGMFVLGFGGSRWTSEIAMGYFRTVAGLGMKLLTMTLMIGIATSVVNGHLADIANGASISQLLVICVVALVLAMLIHSLPNMVAGLIPGGGGAAGSVGSFSTGAVAGAAAGAASTAMSMASNMAGAAQSMYSAFKGSQSSVAAGTDIASRISGMLGGGGSAGGNSSAGSNSAGTNNSAGGATPLSGVMGLASVASGSLGGRADSALSSMSAMAGEASAAGEQNSGAGSEGSAGAGSEASAGGSMQDSPGGSTESASAGSSEALAQAAGGSGRVETVGSSSGATQTKGAAGRSDGGLSSKAGTAGRVALDMGASLLSGMGQMAQSRIDKSFAGKLAAEISKPGSSNATKLDTASSSRSFDPAAEVAAYRDSKQEKA